MLWVIAICLALYTLVYTASQSKIQLLNVITGYLTSYVTATELQASVKDLLFAECLSVKNRRCINTFIYRLNVSDNEGQCCSVDISVSV